MAKKRSPVWRISFKDRAKLLQFLAPGLQKLTADLGRSLVDSGVALASTDGYLVLKIDGQIGKYKLRENATREQGIQFHALLHTQRILANRETSLVCADQLYGFAIGALFSEGFANARVREQARIIEILTGHRAAGGRATKKLNPAQEKIARALISAELKPGVTVTSACKRASAKIHKLHGIEVSYRTLVRLMSPGG